MQLHIEEPVAYDKLKPLRIEFFIQQHIFSPGQKVQYVVFRGYAPNSQVRADLDCHASDLMDNLAMTQ